MALTEIKNDDNLVISPFSLFTGLSMIGWGTAGNTKKQLATALHLNYDNRLTMYGFYSLMRAFNVS